MAGADPNDCEAAAVHGIVRSMSKLYIPDPEEEHEEAFGLLELAALICVGIAALVFYGFSTQEAPISSSPDASEEIVAGLSAEVLRQRSVAEAMGEKSPDKLSSHAWTLDEMVSVLRFGTREVNEVACKARSKQIAEGTLSDPLLAAFTEAVERREESAPFACLMRLYHAQDLPQDSLHEAVSGFWGEVSRHEGNARLIAVAVDEFRKTRNRPESEDFQHWILGCALDFAYEAAPACQRLLHQLSPRHGRDMLHAADKYFEKLKNFEKLEAVITSIGVMSRNGQPHATWRVDETDELPDYDTDFRQAAVLYLCRFVNSPDQSVARAAAFELGKTAAYGARGYDSKLRERWLYTCRLAFGTTGEDDDPALQVISVWDGVEGNAPNYALAYDVERGFCDVREGYPMWYCGTQRWNGEGKALTTALQDFFVESRTIETQDWQ